MPTALLPEAIICGVSDATDTADVRVHIFNQASTSVSNLPLQAVIMTFSSGKGEL